MVLFEKATQDPVAARFVTTARFVTKVTKRAAMPARQFHLSLTR